MAQETTTAFAKVTTNGYSVQTTPTSSPLAASTNELISLNINADTEVIENKKLIMGMEVVATFDDVGADLLLEGSHNGTDWVTLVTIDSDVQENMSGVKTYLVDLTNIFSPYFRLHFNSAKAAVGTSGTAQFFYAFK